MRTTSLQRPTAARQQCAKDCHMTEKMEILPILNRRRHHCHRHRRLHTHRIAAINVAGVELRIVAKPNGGNFGRLIDAAQLNVCASRVDARSRDDARSRSSLKMCGVCKLFAAKNVCVLLFHLAIIVVTAYQKLKHSSSLPKRFALPKRGA